MSDMRQGRRDLSRRPWMQPRRGEQVVVVDPGFLPTTRQMALAVSERVTDYYTPLSPGDSRLLSLPGLRRQAGRRALPPDLAGKARPIEMGTEVLRLALRRAGAGAFEQRLLWRRNVRIDAQIPPLLKAGATVIGQYGGCLESFRRARVLYGRTVLDYPNAHAEAGREILREEALLHPGFADSLVGQVDVEQRQVDRMAAELELADVVVVGSRFAAASFAGVVDAERVHVVQYGVDASKFTPASGERQGGRLRVLFAGQITSRKGIPYLLRAMTLLDPETFALTLVGPITGSGAGLRAYEGLYRHVAAVRPQGMPPIYREADVLVLPSLLEGSALVVLEAMASGLPVIVTPNAGADAVRDGVEGFVVPARSPEAIAGRLQELQTDEGLRRRMGSAARARALGCTWDAFRGGVRALVIPDEGRDAVEEADDGPRARSA